MTNLQKHFSIGWKKTALGDVLKFEQPFKYTVKSSDYNEKSGTPVLTAGKTFILGYTDETENIYANNPVIIFDDFTTDSKFVDFPFKVKSSAMKFLKARNPDETNLKFFFAILQSLKLPTTGGDHKRRWISEFSKIEIDAPPFDEQNRIESVLSKVDEAITKTKTIISKNQRIKTGLMQDLLTKGIDAKGNIRSEQTHKFKTEKGVRVPEDWEVKKLNNCIDKSTVITYGIVQTGSHVENGIRALRTIDLQKDKIDSSNLLRTSIEISNSYKRTLLKKFDIVCNVRASVGDFNIIEEDDLVGCNTTRGVARISPHKEINPYYLLWFLRSEQNTRQMEFLIKGTTFIDINIADLREILIPIPKEKSEQDEIANKLNQIKESINSLTTNLNKLHSIKTGLMQDLLSGKVRVTT